VAEVVESCPGLSGLELARTVCELVRSRRPLGCVFQARECLDLLEALEGRGVVRLPDKGPSKPVGARVRMSVTPAGDPREEFAGDLGALEPIVLEEVVSQQQRLLFRELAGRHHYLGHAVPFGAHLRYLVYGSDPSGWSWDACSSPVRRGAWR